MVITKDRDIDLIEAIEDLESLENEKKLLQDL
jgi:hypothetical protein